MNKLKLVEITPASRTALHELLDECLETMVERQQLSSEAHDLLIPAKLGGYSIKGDRIKVNVDLSVMLTVMRDGRVM